MSESTPAVALETSYPEDTLVYEPVPPVQKVELPIENDRVQLTLTGTAHTGSERAGGPDAGTFPENEHGAGTERFTIVVKNIGPPMADVDQIAVFVAGDMGMIRIPSRGATGGGQSVTGTQPALVNGRLGIIVELQLVGFGSVDTIHFQITCTGRKAPAAPESDGRPDEETSDSPSRFETPPTRDEPAPFDRERNNAFSDDDFS
ncbi:hypothetical protein CRI94_00735 [Longibacter salinarum]|uniref:Uncharacterized protein n=1 Tax=Longibacter salinarum TaxID=1850348 RepID=A0A2A8D1U8_9BACT|nr:hypothetical protein [Longibacter salinarum]PEN14854.1 hypothetical protein CRI94_00735 [Longibacter salinarum]